MKSKESRIEIYGKIKSQSVAKMGTTDSLATLLTAC